MIEHLSSRHNVTVASLARSAEEMEASQELAAHCQRIIVERVSNVVTTLRMMAYLPTSEPSSMAYFYDRRLARRIRQVIAEDPLDIIIVHCSSVAKYVEDIMSLPKLMDYVDMDSQKWLSYSRYRSFPLSLGYAIEGRKLAVAEKNIANKFDVCTVINPVEQKLLCNNKIDCITGWFPNGVDLKYFSQDRMNCDTDQICFLGRMDYYPNQQAMVEFCAEVLPRVRARRPALALSIVGADPSAAVRRLASLPGVVVTGTVADVRPWVRRAALTVAPLKIARGTQNKILESWAMGVPVVASSQAASGIDAVPGAHLLVADEPQAFADAVVSLLENPDERRRLSEAGRARIEATYTWSAAMRKLDSYVATALERHAERRGLADARSANR
jgi:hypothetical protein